MINGLTRLLERVNYIIPKTELRAMFYPTCKDSNLEPGVPGLLSVSPALPRLKLLLEEREKPHIAASHKILQ